MTPDAFIARWRHADGSELANAQSFTRELCELLDVPAPDPARADTLENAYVFERRVSFRHALGAHYTPRAYVERLVLPTVIDPLRAEWSNAHAAALVLAGEDWTCNWRKRSASSTPTSASAPMWRGRGRSRRMPASARPASSCTARLHRHAGTGSGFM